MQNMRKIVSVGRCYRQGTVVSRVEARTGLQGKRTRWIMNWRIPFQRICAQKELKNKWIIATQEVA